MNRARCRSCQLLVDDRASQVRERVVIRFWYADRPDLTDPRAERRVLGELSASAGPHRFLSGRHAGFRRWDRIILVAEGGRSALLLARIAGAVRPGIL